MATNDDTQIRKSARLTKGTNPKFDMYDKDTDLQQNITSNSVQEVEATDHNKLVDKITETGNTSNINSYDYSVIVKSLAVLPALQGSVNDLLGKIDNVLSELSAIKNDITHIKAVLETKADKSALAKLEERIVKLEANINDRTPQTNTNNSTSYADVVKNSLPTLVREELEERKLIEIKKNNLMIFNMTESDNQDDDIVKCKTIFKYINEDFETDELKITRYGIKRDDYVRPICVKISDLLWRKNILSNTRKLKDSVYATVRVRSDLTPKQMIVSKNLRHQLKMKIEQEPGKRWYIRNGTILEREY